MDSDSPIELSPPTFLYSVSQVTKLETTIKPTANYKKHKYIKYHEKIIKIDNTDDAINALKMLTGFNTIDPNCGYKVGSRTYFIESFDDEYALEDNKPIVDPKKQKKKNNKRPNIYNNARFLYS